MPPPSSTTPLCIDGIGPHTNTNRDSAKRQPGHRILNQVWSTSTQEGRTGAVVLSVVCRVETIGLSQSGPELQDAIRTRMR